MIFAFAPAVAPIIGGWIHVTLGWRAVFGFMVMIGVATVARELSDAARDASEVQARSQLHARELARNAWDVMRNREFLHARRRHGRQLSPP